MSRRRLLIVLFDKDSFTQMLKSFIVAQPLACKSLRISPCKVVDLEAPEEPKTQIGQNWSMRFLTLSGERWRLSFLSQNRFSDLNLNFG